LLGTRVDSYQRGADLFLSKPVDARELAAAVKSLATRHLPRSEPAGTAPKPVGVTVWHLNPDHGSLTSPEGTVVRFPAKEFEFMALLGKSVGESVPRNVACLSLYGRDDESSQAALSTLVRRVRQRFVERGIAEPPVITVHSVGYRFAGALSTPSLRGGAAH
jgi:DNA-binding response OmpR family regulator